MTIDWSYLAQKILDWLVIVAQIIGAIVGLSALGALILLSVFLDALDGGYRPGKII